MMDEKIWLYTTLIVLCQCEWYTSDYPLPMYNCCKCWSYLAALSIATASLQRWPLRNCWIWDKAFVLEKICCYWITCVTKMPWCQSVRVSESKSKQGTQIISQKEEYCHTFLIFCYLRSHPLKTAYCPGNMSLCSFHHTPRLKFLEEDSKGVF